MDPTPCEQTDGRTDGHTYGQMDKQKDRVIALYPQAFLWGYNNSEIWE